MNTTTPVSSEETRKGIIFGFLAYGSWGILPIYFRALDAASPIEILAQRILWSTIFCLGFWLWKRNFSWLRDLFGRPHQLILLALSGYILATNWGVYIYAVDSGNVLESSLGYFINPLMLVLVGVIVLNERLSALQWAAVAMGAMAVLIISIDYGRLPWIALTLATSFTIYGFIKKQVGGNVGAVQTMTIETLALVPIAIGMLIWIQTGTDKLTFSTEGWQHMVLMILLGLATMAPLIWFAAAASRLPLVMMGMLQFLAPVGQFLTGVFIFHEAVPTARWIGFGFVWVALILLTFDTARHANNRRRARRTAALAN